MTEFWGGGVPIRDVDSLEQAIACHDTPGYVAALKVLGTGNVEHDLRAGPPASIAGGAAMGYVRRSNRTNPDFPAA